jgi:hypothetical protein
MLLAELKNESWYVQDAPHDDELWTKWVGRRCADIKKTIPNGSKWKKETFKIVAAEWGAVKAFTRSGEPSGFQYKKMKKMGGASASSGIVRNKPALKASALSGIAMKRPAAAVAAAVSAAESTEDAPEASAKVAERSRKLQKLEGVVAKANAKIAKLRDAAL